MASITETIIVIALVNTSTQNGSLVCGYESSDACTEGELTIPSVLRVVRAMHKPSRRAAADSMS